MFIVTLFISKGGFLDERGGFSDERGLFGWEGGFPEERGAFRIKFHPFLLPEGGKRMKSGQKRMKLGQKRMKLENLDFIRKAPLPSEKPPFIRKAPFHPESPLFKWKGFRIIQRPHPDVRRGQVMLGNAILLEFFMVFIASDIVKGLVITQIGVPQYCTFSSFFGLG